MSVTHRSLLLLILVTVTGCLDRSRFNASCRWTEPARSQAADSSHLVSDVALAEELGIRLGDSLRGRLSVSERGRLGTQCTDSLLGVVAAIHHVPTARLAALRGTRDPRADFVTVTLPLCIVLALLAWVGAGSFRSRTSELSSWLAAAFAVVAAFCAAGLFYVFGTLWAGVAENLRIGNGHLSYRGERIPWNHAAGTVISLATVVFLAAWAARRRGTGVGRPSN